MPCCVPPTAPRGDFRPGPVWYLSCLVTFPGPVQREYPQVAYAAVQRQREHLRGKISALVSGVAVLSH